jgi:hypothetical protein
LPPLRPDEPPPLRDDVDDERREEALPRVPPEFFARELARGVLFEAPRLFDPLPLFDALEPELPADLALEPFEACELFFCLLDDLGVACAISLHGSRQPGLKRSLTPADLSETLWTTLWTPTHSPWRRQTFPQSVRSSRHWSSVPPRRTLGYEEEACGRGRCRSSRRLR